MATGPRGGLGTSMSSGSSLNNSMFDPSVLFDLDDILMAGDCSNDMHTSLVHTPIKEEPEYDQDDSRYVHSPIGLPIPSRNSAATMGVDSGFASIKQETGGLIGESPAGGMWGSVQRDGAIPFPVTPFNTPAHGTPAFGAPDLRSFFLAGTGSVHHQFHHHHHQLNANPTLGAAIKEEFISDIEPNLEVMKDDDIFQVDKADLIQGPTLAELNANDESLLGDFNFDDFVMPAQLAMNGDRSAMRSIGGSMMSGAANSVGFDRFRMSDLNAAFASSPSLSNLNDLHRTRNILPGMGSEDDYSQLGSVQIGFDLEQLPPVDVAFTGTPFASSSGGVGVGGVGVGGGAEVATTGATSALSASLPANFGHVSLSKLTRRTEEGGRVKPPPPYPTSPPQKTTSSASALQELLSIRSPGRLPSPNPTTGSHSPSPTAQRPSYSGGARQRTTSNSMSSPAPGQNIPSRTQNLAATNPLLLARLSSSAPAPSILGAAAAAAAAAAGAASGTGVLPGNPESSAWQRREPRNRLFSTSSLAEEVHGSASSISTGFDSDDDSDHYEDFDDSDSDSRVSDEDGRGEARAGSSSSKKERFFWQYNVQAKGPKGHRISLAPETVDPHVLNKVQDPVFSPYCSVDGIKHSGKARRGDGNDLTPNPRKLHNIGRELDKLNRLINDMTPVSELPMAIRPKSRKEKNKLASRACRLKKKAQHEANKVKLYGLEQEHRKLMNAISQAKLIIASKYDSMTGSQNTTGVAPPIQDAGARIERIVKSIANKVKIAGHSTEFVNRVLERVKAGEPSGGLDEL